MCPKFTSFSSSASTILGCYSVEVACSEGEVRTVVAGGDTIVDAIE